jgi:hypothetical protein
MVGTAGFAGEATRLKHAGRSWKVKKSFLEKKKMLRKWLLINSFKLK